MISIEMRLDLVMDLVSKKLRSRKDIMYNIYKGSYKHESLIQVVDACNDTSMNNYTILSDGYMIRISNDDGTVRTLQSIHCIDLSSDELELLRLNQFYYEVTKQLNSNPDKSIHIKLMYKDSKFNYLQLDALYQFMTTVLGTHDINIFYSDESYIKVVKVTKSTSSSEVISDYDSKIKKVLGDYTKVNNKTGGLTNHSYIVKSSIDNELYVVRENSYSEGKGIDRECESEFMKFYSTINPTYQVKYFNEDLLITKFIKGIHPTRNDLCLAQVSKRRSLVSELHKLHNSNLELDVSEVNMIDFVTTYTDKLSGLTLDELDLDYNDMDDYSRVVEFGRSNHLYSFTYDIVLKLKSKMENIAKVLDNHLTKTLCHFDINPLNILINEDDYPTFIDWEYACKSYFQFDYASLTLELNDWLIHYQEPQLMKEIEKQYGKSIGHEINLMMLLQDYCWSIWSLEYYQDTRDTYYLYYGISRLSRLINTLEVNTLTIEYSLSEVSKYEKEN